MSLTPETPDFQPLSSVERLQRVDPFSRPAEVDVAIAQDVLHNRVDVKKLQLLPLNRNDYSTNGDSISTWVYRLGGQEAVIESLQKLPADNPSRETLAQVAQNMLPANDWIREMAGQERNLRVLGVVLKTAIDRGDEEAIATIEKRLGDLKPVAGGLDEYAFGWLSHDIENYHLVKSFEEAKESDPKEPVPFVFPFAADPQLRQLQRQTAEGQVSEAESNERSSEIFRTRSANLRRVVADAVRRKDINLLQEYLGQSEYSGNLMEDRLRYTLGEVTILMQGINYLEQGDTHTAPAAVYNIDDAEELEKLFQKEANKYTEQIGDSGISVAPAPLSDPSFWITMRLGELKNAPFLKRILDHPYASDNVKKEAVRQLLLIGETQFLKEYGETAEESVNFWDVKQNLDRSPDAIDHSSLDDDSHMNRLIEKPAAYAQTIVA